MPVASPAEYQRERKDQIEAEAANYQTVTGILATVGPADAIESVAPNLRESYLLALLTRDARIWKKHYCLNVERGIGDDDGLTAMEAGRTERVAKPPEPWLSYEQRKASSRRSLKLQAKRRAERTPAPAPKPERVHRFNRPRPRPEPLTREERNARRVAKRKADRAAGIPPKKRTPEQYARKNAARRLAREAAKAARALPGPVPGSTRAGIALRPMATART